MTRLLSYLAAAALVVGCGRTIPPEQRCRESSECPLDRVCTSGFCVLAQGLTLITDTLPPGTVGEAYSARLEARAGTPPWAFSLEAGAGLPPGLVLSGDGVLSGVPTQAGSAVFTVQVTDAAGASASKELVVAVEPPSGAALEIATATLEPAQVSTGYRAQLTARGGVAPYQWTVASGLLPGGLTLSPGGELSGTSTTAGVARFTVQVSDASIPAQLATANLEVQVNPASGEALTVVTSGMSAGTLGSPYDAQLEARGGQPPYVWSLAAGTALPSGLSLEGAGAIAGTPAQAGTSTFSVQVTDSASPAQLATAQLAITIGDNGLLIVTSALPGAQLGQPYLATLAASGGSAPYTFSLSSGSLPAGLQLSPPGELSGTPTSPGTFAFSLQATDSSSPAQVATRSFSITVLASSAAPLRVTTTTLPDARVGQPYQLQLSASGGTAPHGWSLGVGAQLPAGLSLSGTGLLSGTPSTAGRFSFTVMVVDAAQPQQTASAALSLTVVLPGSSLSITTASLANGTVGIPYNQQLAASGGTLPYTWVVSTGALPGGLSLSSGGLISGSPGSAGSFSFTAQVSDGSSPAQAAQASFVLTINAGAGLQITTASLPPSTVARAYEFQLQAASGVAPYGWSVDSGTLPAGLSLSAAGVLAGTPTASGAYSFTVEVTDAAGQSALRQYSLTVLANPASSLAILTSQLPNATVGITYNGVLAAAGGSAPYSFSLAAQSLPPGLTLEPAGRISGTPTTSGSFSFTVRVTDSASPAQSSERQFTLQVNPGAGGLLITTNALPPGRVGLPYTANLAAAGGAAPYSWAIAAGALPAGVSLSGAGSLSGAPTTAGTSSFSVQVTDSGGKTASKQLSILVRP